MPSVPEPEPLVTPSVPDPGADGYARSGAGADQARAGDAQDRHLRIVRTAEFELPASARADRANPLEPRDSSRLLVADRQNGTLEHRQSRDCRR